jgi:hypothetical protein
MKSSGRNSAGQDQGKLSGQGDEGRVTGWMGASLAGISVLERE